MAKRTPTHKDRPLGYGNFSELGFSGLPIFSGQIRDEYLPELKGKNGIRVIREMRDNSPIIGAILFAIQMLMRQAEWKVTPHPDKPDATPQEDIEFIMSCMHDMSETWPDVVSEALTMMPFGWAWLEVVYKKREGISRDGSKHSRFTDGKIGWRKMPLRGQESWKEWKFDDRGNVQAMVQRLKDGREATIPIVKSLLFRTTHDRNNPEGRSVLRNSYRPWYFSKRIEEIEGIGIERDLAGLPVITPAEDDDIWNVDDPEAVQAKTEAETIVKSIRRDEQEGIVLPFGWTLELLSTGGRRSFDTNAIIQRYVNTMAMTMLADFIVLGHNNRYGSFALSSNKTHMFGLAVGGWMQSIAGVYNRYAIPRLLELNSRPIEYPPQLDPGDIELPDLMELGSYIANLSKSGFQLFPNVPLEEKLLHAANLPVEGMDLGREPKPTPGFDAEGNPLPDPNKQQDDGDEPGDTKPRSKTGGGSPDSKRPATAGGANPRSSKNRVGGAKRTNR